MTGKKEEKELIALLEQAKKLANDIYESKFTECVKVKMKKCKTEDYEELDYLDEKIDELRMEKNAYKLIKIELVQIINKIEDKKY